MSVGDRRDDPVRGTIIDGKFRVVRTIGAGGMGVVVEVDHLALGGKLAIKLLRGEAAQHEDAARRFSQEAQIASRLNSEHVVRVFDLGRTAAGEPYIVMELLTGEDLASLLARESPLDIDRAVDLVLQASLGVAAAHAEGLVHRDLKPANLFLASQSDRTKIVKVLDFGLSKNTVGSAPALTASSSSFGTPQYMSPEQVMSTKNVDHRSDQHALAMVLYELLTGRPPYQGETSAAVTVLIVTAPPPSARAARRQVPPRLDEAVRRGLAKKADDRFEDLGAFACAIAPYGGPDAVRLAARVQQLLTARPRQAAPGRSSFATDEDASTVPAGHRPDSETVTAVLPSDPERGGLRVRLVTSVAVASMAITLALALVAFVALRGGGAPPALGGSAELLDAPAQPSSQMSAPSSAAGPEPASSASAAWPGSASATVPISSPSGSAAAPITRRSPAGGSRAQDDGSRARGVPKAPTSSDPGDIFGARRKSEPK